MHRFILKAKPGEIVDHINQNTLDNRIENLKISSRGENKQNFRPEFFNQRKLPCGVQRRGNKFRAKIKIHQKSYNLGTFDDPILAGLAYDEAADKFYGPFGFRNFGHLLSLRTAKIWIQKNSGLFFSAIFVKRSDKKVRYINCRTGVTAGCTGKGLRFSPSKYNLLPVFDISIKSHRFVNLKDLLALIINKRKVRIDRNSR